jgi:hypothetical protein
LTKQGAPVCRVCLSDEVGQQACKSQRLMIGSGKHLQLNFSTYLQDIKVA